MKKKSCFSLCILLLFYISSSNAQNLVNVIPSTGAANVNIPIYTVTSGSLSVPLSIYYNTNGVKIKDVEGTAGMGWNLQAGGEVSREVRGLPDDFEQNNEGTEYLGWMLTSNSGPGKVAGFTPANVGDGTCSKETTDVNYINSNFYYYLDTEPDIFDVNAPGLSCQMVFDPTLNVFHPLVYQDLKISYTSFNSDHSFLVSFTITNEKGVKYVFENAEVASQTAFDGSDVYFSTQYNQYKYGVSYDDKWMLTSMTDAEGNSISFTYAAATGRVGVDSVSLYLPGSTTPTLQYYMQTIVSPQILKTINTGNVNESLVQRLAFNWQTFATGQTCVTSITGYGRQFNFLYSPVTETAHTAFYARNFLRNYTENGANSPINYSFTYNGESYDGAGAYTSTLPDSNSFQVDYWGYPNISSTNTSLQARVLVNPSNSAYSRYVIYQAPTETGSYSFATTNGQDRSASTTNVAIGCLATITTAQGGTSTITYEPNTYIDAPSGVQVSGGGVRVQNITDYNGMDATKNIVRNYTYTNPGSTTTSGKPVSLPSYAFTIPYSGSLTSGQALWDAVTVLSKTDLSNDDHSIIYGYFTMSRTGAGTTQYHLSTLGTNWDSNVVPICTGCSTVEWNPTINLSSRTNCSLPAYGPVKNDIYSYPFIPSLNFDFERGLPISVITTNDALQKVSETDYTYQQYPGPFHLSKITGFHTDDNPGGTLLVKGYNLYSTYYNAGELTATVTKKVYDNQTLTNAESSAVSYTYGSIYHELPTAEAVTNSDNSTVTTNISYVKDYPISASSSNANINALYQLQLENVNMPVETYQQVNRSGTILTTSASLSLFSGYTTGSITHYLPSQQYKMYSSGGEVFSRFSINTTAPSISKDPGYFLTANSDTYDNTGTPLTVDDGNKHINTSLRDLNSGMPTAVFTNTSYNEVAFDDFDSQFAPPVSTFTISGTGFTANGSHTGNAYGLNTSQTVTSGTLTKNAITENYIFSIWINAGSTGGTLTLNLTGISPSPQITYPAGGWTYYELKIPVGTLASTYTLSFSASTAISIDDILFYPEAAEVSTVSYDPTSYYKTAVTNTNGISNYFTYDTWGRLTFKYDQFKNIVEKRTYINAQQIAAGLNPLFSYTPTTAAINFPVKFQAYTSASISGNTYTWNFGDGTGNFSNIDVLTQTHTFTTANTYTVSLTISNPVLGYATTSKSVQVLSTPPALVPHMCSAGVKTWNNETNAYTALFPVTSCGGGSTTNTYFTVQVDNVGYGTVTYQWQQKLDKSGSTWTNVGSNTSTWNSPSYSGVHQYGYQIQCIVSAPGQTSGTASSAVSAIN